MDKKLFDEIVLPLIPEGTVLEDIPNNWQRNYKVIEYNINRFYLKFGSITLNSRVITNEYATFGHKWTRFIQGLKSGVSISKGVSLHSNSCCVFLESDRNFYHFVHDTLPFMLKMSALGILNIVPFWYTWQLEILEFLKVDYKSSSGLIIGTNIMTISRRPISSIPRYDVVNFLSVELLKRVNPFMVPKDLIYISRQKAINRKIVDEDQLIDYLILLNIKIIVLEDLSFEEQLLKLSRAKLVIAPHGAGLTICSIIGKAKIIELEFIDRINPCFKSIVNGRAYYTSIKAFEKRETGDYKIIPDVFEKIAEGISRLSR